MSIRGILHKNAREMIFKCVCSRCVLFVCVCISIYGNISLAWYITVLIKTISSVMIMKPLCFKHKFRIHKEIKRLNARNPPHVNWNKV